MINVLDRPAIMRWTYTHRESNVGDMEKSNDREERRRKKIT